MPRRCPFCGVNNMACFAGSGFSFPLGKKTYVMGILNVTPDSFLDGGRYFTPEKAAAHAQEMEAAGADLIDIGAQSTRPGHTPRTATEELAVLQTMLPAVRRAVSLPLSVDTFFPEVARYALENGVSVVNDVSGTLSVEMAAVVREFGAGWVLMHTGGADASTPAVYKEGVLTSVRDFFSSAMDFANEQGLPREQICLDPGFGFGKSAADDLTLLRGLSAVKAPGCALLAALSCKRMVARASGTAEWERLCGTIAADTLAIAGGADMIRVHHVKEAVAAAKFADAALL